MKIADISFNKFCELIRAGTTVTDVNGTFKYINVNNEERIIHQVYLNDSRKYTLHNTFSFQEFYSHLFCEQHNETDTDLNSIEFKFTDMLQSELDELVNK